MNGSLEKHKIKSYNRGEKKNVFLFIILRKKTTYVVTVLGLQLMVIFIIV